MTIVGTVVELRRFPVKSMAGERPEAVELRWQGIAGDRRFGFYRARDRGRFPWLSARDHSLLVLYRAAFRDPGDPKGSAVEVTTPDGERLPVEDPSLLEHLAQAYGDALEILQVTRGAHDAMPVSVATTATHAAIDAAHGRPVERARFRTNIVIDSGEREIAWCGRTLVFGEAGAFGEEGARLVLADPIPRCALITIDPATGVRDASILRTVAQRFDNRVGVYGATARPGMIRVGDAVRSMPTG